MADETNQVMQDAEAKSVPWVEKADNKTASAGH